jgi:hypothetical protein
VVALLTCAGAPTVAPVAALPRFAPRIALAATSLAGALAMVVFLWLLDPGPAIISADTYRQLREQRLVKNLTEVHDSIEKRLEGEVTTLDHPVIRQVGLTKPTFTLPLIDADLDGKLGRGGLGVTIRTGGMDLWAPRWWQALIMLAVPLGVAVLIGRLMSPVRLLIGKD